MTAPILIVGAGAYGLAVAQELWHRGVAFRVVGAPFALWFDHTPDGMFLRSDPRSSEVHSRDGRYSLVDHLRERNAAAREAGAPPVHAPGAHLTVAVYRDYLRRVVARLPFALERDEVVRLAAGPAGFRATTAAGVEIEAGAVVVATGGGAHLHLPPALAALPPGRVLHTWRAREIAALRGERVLVVGGGQSAAEAVETLRGGNEVVWALHRPPFFLDEPARLPAPVFKLFLALAPAYFHLPGPLHRGLGRLFLRPTVMTRLRPLWDDPGVPKLLADASALGLAARDGAGGPIGSAAAGEFDRVVAATGFRHRLGGLAFLDPDLRRRLGPDDGVPDLDADFQTRVGGLYLAGGIAEAAFGPAQRFVLGSWHAARRIGRAVAST
jgi:hypothetical protein